MNTLAVIAATALITLTAPEYPEYIPNAVCMESECSEILYSWGGGIVAAQVIVSDESFLAYVPACYVDCEDYATRVSQALETQVQHRFPQAYLHIF
jgi:hypothetical protein